MSAPLKLSGGELIELGHALQAFSTVTRDYGVRLAPYGHTDVAVQGSTLQIRWDDELECYVVDDRVGS